MRKFTTIERQRSCMTFVRAEAVTVGRRDGTAIFGDVTPCGSRFCPNCGPRIQAQRRDEIRECVEAARARGWTVLFQTLTIGHSAGDPLAELLDAIDVSWRALTRGGFWARTKRQHGLRHFVRVTEQQQGGANGWHPHYHVLFFLDPAEARAYDVRTLGAALIGEWKRVVEAAGYRASLDAQMLIEPTEEHLQLMSSYFTKQLAESMSWEMTGQASKHGRSGSRNPAELLADAAGGDESSRLAWRELEEATKGRRMIAYSAHCREDLRLDPAMRAERAAETPAPEPHEALVTIPRDDWQEHATRAGFRERLAAVVATAHDASVVRWWLHDQGIRSSEARPPEPLGPPIPPGPPGAEWLAVV